MILRWHCSMMHTDHYINDRAYSISPAAIIRNAKFWNIILLVVFFPNVKLKSGFRISCSVRKKLLEESTTTALTPNLLRISTFLGFLKSGGGGGVTAM